MTNDEIQTKISVGRGKISRGSQMVEEGRADVIEAKNACSHADFNEIAGFGPDRPYKRFACNICGHNWREVD